MSVPFSSAESPDAHPEGWATGGCALGVSFFVPLPAIRFVDFHAFFCECAHVPIWRFEVVVVFVEFDQARFDKSAEDTFGGSRISGSIR